METLLEFFKITGPWAGILLGAYLLLNIIGEICEKKNKIVPEFMKIRKYFKRKKQEKKDQAQLMVDMRAVIDEFNSHYTEDNLAQRNCWMQGVNEDREWMHQRAQVYDESIEKITASLNQAANNLKENTKMTEEMFIENSRDRIIDFAEKASDYNCILSREQFRRINKVYDKYEAFLLERHLQNGEVDTAYEMIQDGYKHRLKTHSFVEDLKGYNKKED